MHFCPFIVLTRQFGEEGPNVVFRDKLMPQEGGYELKILFTSGEQLADSQVRRMETVAGDPMCIRRADNGTSLLPTGRQDRCFRPDTVCVIPECLVKWGEFSDAAVNQIRLPGIIKRIGVDLLGKEQLCGSIGEGPQNGLAPQDDQLPGFSDRSGCADNVL